MAQPNTAPFGKFLIYYGDGGSPENFTKLPIAMTSKGFSRDVKNNNITVPDLTNEDLLVWEQGIPSTITAQISGKGVLDPSQQSTWEGFIGVLKDYKIAKTDSANNIIGHWIGACILTKFSETGTRANIMECDLQLDSAGVLTFTAGS